MGGGGGGGGGGEGGGGVGRGGGERRGGGGRIGLGVAERPAARAIKAHSIIAIEDGSIPPEGDDGVVSYKSAHLTDVESELVVPYGHSCQMKPLVIEEVRRILIEHLNAMAVDKNE